ncbi:MAG TPA: cytochrome c peroxidase [Gemmatimonadaceae bacterium]|nr:cytochrome c peroxidase [Gemmatimonadaceae bacterium]
MALIVGCGGEPGEVSNAHPVRLARTPVAALSAVAEVGKRIFFDSNFSANGRTACASCHSPRAAYAAPGNALVQLAAPQAPGAVRAVPSLRYVDRTPNFFIGPDNGESENVDFAQLAVAAAGTPRPTKIAGTGAGPVAMVPRGGLFWDGRVNTLQDQAMGPLFNSTEMGNRDVAAVAATLRSAPYASSLSQLFGSAILDAPPRLVDEAMFAVARFEVEDSSFHPYTSQYDYYLEGEAPLSAAEARGLRVFEDKDRGNCAGCHPDRPAADGTPPAFTDYQYEALGVPRNGDIPANRDARYFDLGLCGPVRTDLATQTQYCGMFRTPSLRNAATRTAFFHNGVYHSLDQVLRFYNQRDTRPETIYPIGADRRVRKFDDLPAAYRKNVDVTDPPFNRAAGDPLAMSPQDIQDVIAFLGTLTDGYVWKPGRTPP